MASEPNDLLRAAREAEGMTQGQVAELANAQVEQATGKPGAMDADYIGKLERGIHHWPNQHYRTALRHVLGRLSDADLGFFSTRFRTVTAERTPGRVNGVLVGPVGRPQAGIMARSWSGLATQPGPASVYFSNGTAGRQAVETEVAMAAAESARFAQFADQTNVGPHTLEQFREDIERIVANYGNRPIYPTFVEVRELRNRAFELLEGRQRPGQTSDLYLIAGLLCAILGEASRDLGLIPAAKTQLRTAFLCGELAGNNWLRAWVRGQQSDHAFWQDQPHDAADFAADGWQYIPETGTARIDAAMQEARARAQLRDQSGVDDALARAGQAREDVHGTDIMGGYFTFSTARQNSLTANAKLLLGGDANRAEAEAQAGQAIELFEAEPPERRQLGVLCLARLTLAVAQLTGDNLEAAAANIGEVLNITAQRPSETVTRRLTQIANTLQRPHYQNTTLALDLRDQIHTATTRPALPATNE